MLQDIAILDIGSGSITVLTGRRGVNNTLIISGKGQCSYAGYSDGKWISPSKLAEAIHNAITACEATANYKITSLYVGVPGDFTAVQCKELNVSFSRKHKITQDDISMLHDKGDNFDSDPNFFLIHSQPIYYTLDDDRRLVDPIGIPSTRLGGCISYILAERGFLDTISSILSSMGIEKLEFVSSILAESLFLFDDFQRDHFVIFIDVGFISTSIVLLRGDGILSLYSIPMGGGYINADLIESFNITYTQAESLKRKLLLSLEPSKGDVYSTVSKDSQPNDTSKMLSFNADEVNDIVFTSIAKLASSIVKCVKMFRYDYPENTIYHITGGGLANIIGARDVLADMLEKQVEIASPKLPHYNKPELSSMLGVLDFAIINSQQEMSSGIFKKLASILK